MPYCVFCDRPRKFAKLLCLIFLHLLVTVSAWADLPAGWSSADMGGPGMAGSAGYTNGNWTVRGERTANPDGDGDSNEEEFLHYSNPTNRFSFYVPKIQASTAQVSIELPNFLGRRATVETSTDLGLTDPWALWLVGGNNSIPLSPGLSNILTEPLRTRTGSSGFGLKRNKLLFLGRSMTPQANQTETDTS